jgi:hypothetical protein
MGNWLPTPVPLYNVARHKTIKFSLRSSQTYRIVGRSYTDFDLKVQNVKSGKFYYVPIRRLCFVWYEY